jgi:DNA-binding IclR family transcriptional regulator
MPAAERSRSEPTLAERILAYVREHPGARLPAIEQALGVSRIEVGRTIRGLMDQGKVRRDEETREYFPL